MKKSELCRNVEEEEVVVDLVRARLCWSLVAKHRRGSIESQPTAASSNTFFLIEVDSRATILKGQSDQISRKKM